MPRDRVFISYSHKDKKWRDDLVTHLKPHLRDGSITGWSDQQVAPGSEWFREIQSALTNSKIAVLLVSPDFLASDFIHQHELGPLLKEAEQGGVKILWVPVRESAYMQTPLKNYHAVLDPGKPLAGMTRAKRDQAWVKICQEIGKAVNASKKPFPEGSLRDASPPIVVPPVDQKPGASNKERTPEWLTIPDQPWTGIPGALLRADLAIVPFHGRDDELAALKEWAKGERKESVALVTGSGGMGKTRLARELCLELRAEGILCGFVEPSDVDICIGFLRARANIPMLLVMDYAETIGDRIADILKVVSKRNLTALRILLLARGAGYWWTKLKRMGAGIGDHLTREPKKLRPLTLGIEARRHSYDLAASAFAERLKRPKPNSEPSDLGASDYERILVLHMAALLAAQGATVQDIHAQGMDSVLERVLAHEAEYWFKELDNRQLPKILEPGFERLVGIICGYGGARDQDEAVEVISKISFFSDQPRAIIEAIANILHDCYPGTLWVEPIQPDLLNEYLVEKATREHPDDFKRIVL